MSYKVSGDKDPKFIFVSNVESECLSIIEHCSNKKITVFKRNLLPLINGNVKFIHKVKDITYCDKEIIFDFTKNTIIYDGTSYYKHLESFISSIKKHLRNIKKYDDIDFIVSNMEKYIKDIDIREELIYKCLRSNKLKSYYDESKNVSIYDASFLSKLVQFGILNIKTIPLTALFDEEKIIDLKRSGTIDILSSNNCKTIWDWVNKSNDMKDIISEYDKLDKDPKLHIFKYILYR